ncbi:MAG TPA: HEAT repeat domain-containing protein [Kofleriaceae bacterium]|nr:HEAT repeat domain-containing protein [Kofleriaceae bacterium]
MKVAWLAVAIGFGAACGKSRSPAPAPAVAIDAAAPPAIDAAPALRGPIVIDRISVHTDETAIDQPALAASLRASMLATGAFTGPDHAGPMARVDVTLAATVRPAQGGDPAGAVVACEVTLHWLSEATAGDEPAPHAHVAATRPLGAAAARKPDDAVRALAADVIAAAGRDLGAREHERALPIDQLAPLFGSADEQQVTWSLELAGARKARALVPAITPLVKRPPPVRDAAISALVAIGDPSAVAAITSAVDFDDRDALSTAIEAAIALGGPDADDFLELIATGHHDSDLAARARDGLRRLARRVDAGTP